ncbi:hypothetical protein BGW38_000100, partial [Lunasporangiospora selenospora]
YKDEQPLVTAWALFVTDSKQEQEKYGRTTTQQQATAFKRIEQAARVQKEKHGEFLERPDFQSAFSQFIAYYYFATAKPGSRKQIFSVLLSLQPLLQQDESDQDGVVVKALRSVIMSDILGVSGQPQIDIDMAWHQKALCLYTTLDYTLGRTALLADLDIILDKLSVLLHARVQATNVQVERDQAPSEHTEAMQDIEFILKLILAIFSRLINATNLNGPSEDMNINQFELSPTHQPPAYIARIFEDAIVVSSSPAYHRDLSSISGMLFANIIDLTAPSVQEVTRRVSHLVFGSSNYDYSFLPEIPRAMVEMDYGWNTYLGDKCGPGEEDAGMYMLGIVRGLLTNIRQEALVMPIEQLSRWYAPEVFEEQDGQQEQLMLHQVLFHAIAYLCATSRDMSSKTSAFETMGHWLQQTKLHLGEKSSASPSMKRALANCIDEQAQEKLTAYVLDYWEDPIDAVQHKVRNILELLLDIVFLKSVMDKEETKTPAYVSQLLKRIIMADSHRKSKYPILAILVGRVSILEMTQMRPDTLAQAITALEQLATAPGAAVAINAMIERSWKECIELDSTRANVLIPPKPVKVSRSAARASEPVAAVSERDAEQIQLLRKQAMQPWIDFWLKPIVQALTSKDDLIRKHLGHFVISPLFSTCSEAFWTLLEVLDDHSPAYAGYVSDEEYRFHAIVSAIKTARSLDLVDSNHYKDVGKQSSSTKRLQQGHIDISVFHSAMHHASADVRIDVLGILCESKRSTTPVSSVEFQLLKQYLPLNMNSVVPDFRQRLYAHMAKFLLRIRGNIYVLAREVTRLNTPVGQKNLTPEQIEAQIKERQDKITETRSFLEWLLEHIFSSLYPGSSFQRVATNLRLLGVIIKTFGIETTPLPSGAKADEISRFPFQLPIATKEHVKTLLISLLDPYDQCREQTFDILSQFRAPFAGYDTKEKVDKLVRWGLDWLTSTRAGESDSGGLVLKIVFVKYAVELGWDIQIPYEETSGLVTSPETGNPAVDFAIRLQNLLRFQIAKARQNQLEAAHRYPMHGTLIGLRYLFSSIDYSSPLVTNHRQLWRKVHADMMSLVEEVCSIVMGVLSNPSPEGNIPATFTEMEESIDAVISAFGGDEDNLGQSSGPNHQVILSYCWRAVKESSALMELVLSKATLSNRTTKVEGVLEPQAMDCAGTLFRRLLTTIRHPGAFSSVFPAFISLCTRLLNSEDTELATLPRVWLEENLDSILSDTISVTRRSAGLPLCILAIVNAELSDTRRTLLPMVMRRVMAIAEKPVSADANHQVDLPQIHAMNVLRRLFMDAKLSTSVLPYVGQGLELSIRAFSSPSWAVRNCGVMLFSTLLHRVFGAKRVRDEHQAINGITSRELFARLEGLCGFLQTQLEVAVQQLLGAESSTDRVHPGLYPVLTLLSRLQPSLEADPADATEENGGLMEPFVVLVRRCAASAIWKTREMAARALIPLVASRNLINVVTDILRGCLKPRISQNEIHGLLVQVQFLLRGHLQSEGGGSGGVADRAVRRSFVSRFADAIGPVTERVLQYGCQMNRWMVLSIFAEFVFGQDWMGSDREDSVHPSSTKTVITTESDMDVDTTLSKSTETEREEMKRLSDVFFKGIRNFMFDYSLVGLLEDKGMYRNQVGGHLVRRLMARNVILAIVSGVNTVLSKEQAMDMMVSLLNDPDYEVRLETLETLQSLWESSQDGFRAQLDAEAIHRVVIQLLFNNEKNLECLRVEVAMMTALGEKGRPFAIALLTGDGAGLDIVEFWNRLFRRMDDRETGSVAVVEAILPAIGNVFAQIWNDSSIPEALRIDCLSRWAKSIHKHAHEDQTLQLREAAMESMSSFSDRLLDPVQHQSPSEPVTRAYLELFEALTWQLQDDEQEVREAGALVVSRGLQLPSAISAEKALTLVYDHQLNLFAGAGKETQCQMLVNALVSQLMGTGKPASIVQESLQPNKVLFDKESPNLFREPLVSMQLVQRSLELILSGPSVPTSIIQGLRSLQGTCVEEIREINKTAQEPESSGGISRLSPWGISSQKPVFEVLWKLACGSHIVDGNGAQNSGDKEVEEALSIVRDTTNVHPVVVEAGQRKSKDDGCLKRFFLIE